MIEQMTLDMRVKNPGRYYDKIVSKILSEKHLSQSERIFKRLYEASIQGRKVSLPEILDMRIAKYSSRITELRQLGFSILCVDEGTIDGEKHTSYKLEGV